MNEKPRKRNLSGCNILDNSKRPSPGNTLKENVPPDFSDLVDIQPCKADSIADNEFQRTTPKKSQQNLEEPVTPSTNFKLLTAIAAAQDYANCTPKVSYLSFVYVCVQE